MARGSPKGMSKSGGLDVEAELRYAEVQKGWASVADWTLKEREGIRKSKRDEQERWIGC
jgi:hypothetical protein